MLYVNKISILYFISIGNWPINDDTGTGQGNRRNVYFFDKFNAFVAI